MNKTLWAVLVIVAGILCAGADLAFAKYYMPIPAENSNVRFYNSEDGQIMYMENEGDEPVLVAFCVVTMMGPCNPFKTNPHGCGAGDPTAKDLTPEQFFEALSHWKGAILWPGGRYNLWYRICPGKARHSIRTIYFKHMEGEQLEGFYDNIRQYKSGWNFDQQYF